MTATFKYSLSLQNRMRSLLGIRIDPWETRKELALKAGIVAAIVLLCAALFYFVSLLWGNDKMESNDQSLEAVPELNDTVSEHGDSEPIAFLPQDIETTSGPTLPFEKVPLKNAKSVFYATNGSVYDLKQRTEDIIVLNPDLYPDLDVEFLRVSKNVFAHISVGLADQTKEYWNRRAVYLVDQYGGNFYYVDFSRSAWHEIVINEATQAKKKGYEGIVLENVDQGYKRSTEERFLRLRQGSMEDLIKTISSFVHDGKFMIFVEDGEEMYPEILDSIDGVIVEHPLDEEYSEKVVVIVKPKE